MFLYSFTFPQYAERGFFKLKSILKNHAQSTFTLKKIKLWFTANCSAFSLIFVVIIVLSLIFLLLYFLPYKSPWNLDFPEEQPVYSQDKTQSPQSVYLDQSFLVDLVAKTDKFGVVDKDSFTDYSTNLISCNTSIAPLVVFSIVSSF